MPTILSRRAGVAPVAARSILQVYTGLLTAANFEWTGPSHTLLTSGYPLNPTFTKLSSTSYLHITLNGDYTTGSTAADSLYLALYIDGVLEQNINNHTSLANDFASISWSKVTGGYLAGAHTLDVRVGSASGAGTKVFRCSTSVDLEIVEFEI